MESRNRRFAFTQEASRTDASCLGSASVDFALAHGLHGLDGALRRNYSDGAEYEPPRVNGRDAKGLSGSARGIA